MADQASTNENEIEGILRDASERVRRFQAAAQHKEDAKELQQKVSEVEAKYEAQRRAAYREFDEFKRRAQTSQVELPPCRGGEGSGDGLARMGEWPLEDGA